MVQLLAQLGVHTGEPVGFALSVVASVLGLAVGYLAFRGYRQNRSLPMLFIAVGFLLAFWTPVLLLAGFGVLGVVGQFAPGMEATVDTAFSLAGETSRIIGLLCILYGLRMPFGRE
ncbi:hypothetical protein ACFQDG_04530 [Natronoarchaeum mannanilyticum]|uniref:Uncharacterized protein n=2 Tax=Natronoarchaeum mannanilyticum TaxID=926360 RepID=A0AAV3TE97_9EURY